MQRASVSLPEHLLQRMKGRQPATGESVAAQIRHMVEMYHSILDAARMPVPPVVSPDASDRVH